MSKIMAKKVFKKISENIGKSGKVSISRAMREVGFSPSYSKQPHLFTKTKVWTELTKEYLPDEELTRKHRELLNACGINHYVFPRPIEAKKKKGKERTDLTNTEIRKIVESVPGCRLIYVKRDILGAWAFYQAPDNRSRQSALDMAYKLSGKYAPSEIALVRRKFEHLTNAELAELIKKTKEFLTKK